MNPTKYEERKIIQTSFIQLVKYMRRRGFNTNEIQALVKKAR